jgi:hypothetical protein
MLGVALETKRGEALLRSDPAAAEIHCAAIAAVWGVLLVLPGNTFSTTPSYDAMAHIMPEWCWGVMMLALSCQGIVGVVTAMQSLRRTAALYGVVSWSLIAWLLVLANPWATGGYVYLLTAITHGSTYWRLGARYVGKSAR